MFNSSNKTDSNAVNSPESQEQNCSTASEMGRKTREFIDHASHDARDVTASVKKQIRTNPVMASAIAAGVGFVIGNIFSRR
ncbi:MAG: hypothetical protein ACOYK8_06395 [Alphaproteobacteria bacterium]